MLVPQVFTVDVVPDTDALGVFRIAPNVGSFATRDFSGRPMPMGEILRAVTPAALAGKLARAGDMSVAKVVQSGSVRFVVSWPGYKDWEAEIHVGSMASMTLQVAGVFKQFFALSAGYRRPGGSPEWNIQAKRFSVDDFALVAIVHLGGNNFAAEIEHISRPGVPRGRF